MRRVVGCMTGTSIDGLDCALVEIEGSGLDMKARFVRGGGRPLGSLQAPLRALAAQGPTAAGDVAAIMREFSLLHSAAVRELLNGQPCDLICVHGQTVFHKPPLSWQLFQPATLAWELRTPVVCDLRQADLAAGGQGAPITPIADWVLFRRHGDPMAVVNLGGFSNYTSWFTDLSPDEEVRLGHAGLDIRGGDICVCNQLLDALARHRLERPFDKDGSVAASGTPDVAALRDLQSLLGAQASTGRSLGTGDEISAWVARASTLPTPTALRTACEAVAATIANAASTELALLLGGGGTRNRALVSAIRDRWRGPVRSTDDVGVPAEHREAACFAVLGSLSQDRVPITLPRVTKVREPAPIAGVWVHP